ncbi:hypothetical protein D3C83_274110 [compost metagenome]
MRRISTPELPGEASTEKPNDTAPPCVLDTAMRFEISLASNSRMSPPGPVLRGAALTM